MEEATVQKTHGMRSQSGGICGRKDPRHGNVGSEAGTD